MLLGQVYNVLLDAFGFEIDRDQHIVMPIVGNELQNFLNRWNLPFAINLVANVNFTPIQFGMRNLPLAAVDILIVWVRIIWMSVVIWKNRKWVAVAQIPYFVWVSIAAMNWGRP